MKTPFCTAFKLASRSVEEIRARIGEAQEEIASLKGRAAMLRAMAAAERSCLAGDLRLPETRWFGKTAADRQAVAERRGQLDGELVLLREEASTRLASLRGLEEARKRYRSERARTHARREQAQADDRAARLFRASVCARQAGAGR